MDHGTFKKFVQTHKNAVFSYATYLVRNRQDAEDITQDVFVKLWQNMDKIDKNKTKAWIMRVAHNLCIDQIRRNKSLRSGPSEEGNQAVFVQNPGFHDADPEGYMEFREMQKEILEALARLPEKTRCVLLMHYFQDLKLDTISDIMNENLNTVKVTLHRGRKLLHAELKSRYPDRVGEAQHAYRM
ncbi:RNA polymerase sigma factor [bacterium]|nr:RNA polymerase sigma factor [bacterium]